MSRALSWAAICFALSFFTEVGCVSLRTKRGDDDGDDDGGGMGGLGGALTSLFGGAGGAGAKESGGGGDDDDDDPNMVGSKHGKKGKHKGKGKGGDDSGGGVGGKGVDLDGLEKGLAEGGVGQLTQMLTAMRAAQGSGDNHIKKGPNGEDMYDFRDLDDGADTTAMPPITMSPPVMVTPPPAPEVDVPSMPTLRMGADGRIIGGDKALKKQEAKTKKEQAEAEAAGKLTVWPPMPKAHVGVKKSKKKKHGRAQAPPAVQAPPVLEAPQAAPQAVPMVQPMMAAAAPGANPLLSGLEQMRQNMDMLLNAAAQGRMGAPAAMPAIPMASNAASNAKTDALSSRLDQMSQMAMAVEQKMETRMEALEGKNTAMQKTIDDEATEIKALKQETEEEAKSNQKLEGQVKKLKTKGNSQVEKTAKTSAKKVAAGSKVTKEVTKKVTKKVKTVNQAPAYATAPWDATFKVHLDGKADGQEDSFTIRVHPEWAPEGAKRFQDMVQAGILDDARFFRVVKGFMVQFGIPGMPKVAQQWLAKRIKDDPVKQSNTRGMVTFATSGPNTRTTQMFVNYANNDFLDKQGFSPFAEVLGDGMSTVEDIQSKYKERPNQAKVQHHGNKYLKKHFPDLSFVSHVDSTLPKAAPVAAGLIQEESEAPEEEESTDKESEAPEVEEGSHKAYRYGGVATFYHHKVKKSE